MGGAAVVDLTHRVQEELPGSPFDTGLVTVFVPGSSGGIMTMESGPGLLPGPGGALGGRARAAPPAGVTGRGTAATATRMQVRRSHGHR